MANITISDLNLDGSDLFMDSEGFMRDLAEDELTINQGGITPGIFAAPLAVKITVGVVVAGGIILYGPEAAG